MLWFFFGFIWAVLYAFTLKKKNLLLEIKKHYKVLVLFSLTNAIGNVAYFYSVNILGSSVTTFLDKMDLFYAFLFGIFLLGEKYNMKETLGLILAFVGVLLLTYSKDHIEVFAAIVYLVSLVIYTYGFVIIKKNIEKVDSFSFMFVRTIIIFLVSASLTFSTGSYLQPTGLGLYLVIIVPLFTAVIAQDFNYKALKYVDVSKATIVKNVGPFLVMLWSFLFFNEVLSPQRLLGGIIIIAGVTMIILFRKKKENIETVSDSV